MSVLELFEGDLLLKRCDVEEPRARAGVKVKLSKDSSTTITLGETQQIGRFRVVLRPEGPSDAPASAIPTAGVDGDAPTATKPSPRAAEKAPRVHRPEIEGYEMLSPVGEGGMGVVWRARQLATGREVAVKLMSADQLGAEGARARFEREVRVAAALESPSIARVYDSGVHRGVYFYAMELISGVHLDKYVKRGLLDRRRIAELVLECAAAVQYAHSRGVVHRDLKPSNVMVRDDGRPVIVDFGLARAITPSEPSLVVSHEGDAAGTPAYMSPEQAAGRQLELDRRTDVFALGAILYRLTTGHFPRDMSGAIYDVLKRLAEEPIIPPSNWGAIEPDLEAILMCACALRREDRYATAGELADDLRRYLAGAPVIARRYGLLERTQIAIRKYQRVSLVVLLLLLGFGTIGATAWMVVKRTRDNNARLAEVAKAEREHREKLEAELSALQSELSTLRAQVALGAGSGRSAEQLAAAKARIAELQSRQKALEKEIEQLLSNGPLAAANDSITATRSSTPVSAPSAGATPTATPPQASGQNAADVYKAVVATLGEQTVRQASRQVPVTPDLSAYASTLDELVEASKLDRCDFGVDWSDGTRTSIPHLRHLRGLAALLRAQATRADRAGDSDSACRYMATSLRLAAHMASGAHSSIETIIAMSMAEVGCQMVVQFSSFKDSRWKGELQEALVRVETSGLFNCDVIVDREMGNFERWFRNGSVPDSRDMGDTTNRWGSLSQSERESLAAGIASFRVQLISQIRAGATAAQLDEMIKSTGVSLTQGALTQAGQLQRRIDRIRPFLVRAKESLE